MSAYWKVVIAVFLLVLPSVFARTLLSTNAAVLDPNAPPNCKWHKVNEEIECDGMIFIFEAQDKAFTGRWFIDMGIVGFLVVFAGTLGAQLTVL